MRLNFLYISDLLCFKGSEIKTSSLELGKNELLVLGVVSPMEMYLVTEQQFDQYSDVVAPVIAEVAENADYVLKIQVGDLVLALNDDFWCRAKVVSITDDNIEVDLFDLAIIKVKVLVNFSKVLQIPAIRMIVWQAVENPSPNLSSKAFRCLPPMDNTDGAEVCATCSS